MPWRRHSDGGQWGAPDPVSKRAMAWGVVVLLAWGALLGILLLFLP